MARMQECGVNLVLHGHRHREYSCRVNYFDDRGDTVVVAAGTACQDGKAAPSFSVVSLVPGYRVVVQVYRYEETGFKLDQTAGRIHRLK